MLVLVLFFLSIFKIKIMLIIVNSTIIITIIISIQCASARIYFGLVVQQKTVHNSNLPLEKPCKTQKCSKNHIVGLKTNKQTKSTTRFLHDISNIQNHRHHHHKHPGNHHHNCHHHKNFYHQFFFLKTKAASKLVKTAQP